MDEKFSGPALPSQECGESPSINRLQWISLAILVAALWLATRPYQGIFHDSRFYTAEVLNLLHPGQFSQDLYFQFGSQGRFTIFSYIYAPLISHFGMSGGNIVLTIASQGSWLGGLFYICHILFRDWKVTAAAMVAAILLPSGTVFHYGEPYVTPRTIAEALTFWALGVQLSGRPVGALLLLALSMLVHPLMTLPGLAVWFLREAVRRRILWLLPALAVVGVVGLALAGVQPFSRLLVRFDPVWFEIVRVRDDFCFVSLWGFDRWLTVGSSVLLGIFELTLAVPSERRLLVPVFVVGIGGILLSFVGGDLLHNVLVFDIQTWRSMWLFTLIANLFAPKMLVRFVNARPATSPMAAWALGLALASMIVASFLDVATLGAVILLASGVCVGCWEWIAHRPASGPMRLILALLAGCAFGAMAIGASILVGRINLRPDQVWDPLHQLILSLGILAAMLFLLPWFRRAIIPGLPVAVSLVGACVFAILAIWRWDQRTPWNRFIDASDAPAELVRLLPGSAPIYWEDSVATPWFLLKRASYFTCDQGAGTLFSRETAVTYQDRYANFQKLQTLDFRQYSFCPLTDARRTTPLQRAQLSTLCTKEPGLGALVLTQRVADAPYRLWVSPVAFQDMERQAGGAPRSFSADHFYIYSCAELR